MDQFFLKLTQNNTNCSILSNKKNSK